MTDSAKQLNKRMVIAQRITIVVAALSIVSAGMTASRDQFPGDAVLEVSGWADESTCKQCHVEADTYPLTGHAQTLRSASAPRSLEILKTFAGDELKGNAKMKLEFDQAQRVVAVQSENGLQRRLSLDWCFGSGDHAHTWVSTTNDRLGSTNELEFRWTWYREIDGFDLTPGQVSKKSLSHFGKFGLLFDGAKAVQCFSCHASHVPAENSSINFHGLEPSINCQRCHGPQQAHVASGGDVSIDAWTASDRMDAVNRCGQCHRSADEQNASEIRSDNIEIVRFQPVGLVQSRCFTESPMTCITCHDPHKPLSAQDSRGIWQCVQCHDPAKPQHTTCAAEQADNCLSCHMPEVLVGPPVKFTDHWIRVRDDAKSNR